MKYVIIGDEETVLGFGIVGVTGKVFHWLWKSPTGMEANPTGLELKSW